MGTNCRQIQKTVTNYLGQCCVCLLIGSTLGQMGKKRLEEACAAAEEMRSWRRQFPFPAAVGCLAQGLTTTPCVSWPGPRHPCQDSSMAPPVLPQTLDPPRRESRTGVDTKEYALSSISQSSKLCGLHLIPKKPRRKAAQIPF